MFNPYQFKDVKEYIDGLCDGKQFKSEKDQLAFRQKLLETFEKYRSLTDERDESYRRKSMTWQKDKRAIRKEQKEYQKTDKSFMRTLEDLKGLIAQVVDIGPEVEFGSDPDRALERYVDKMMAVDKASREPKQSTLDGLKVKVNISEAVKKTQESKDQHQIEEKQGQEPVD